MGPRAERFIDNENQPVRGGIGRREALKLGAGVGAAAVVWAEPTVKGFARTPAYALAGSGGTVTAFNEAADGPHTLTPDPDGGFSYTSATTGVKYRVAPSGGSAWRVFLSAVGCSCTATGGFVTVDFGSGFEAPLSFFGTSFSASQTSATDPTRITFADGAGPPVGSCTAN